MTPEFSLSSAFCTPFLYTSAGAGADFSIKIGTTGYPGTLPTSWYRWLAGYGSTAIGSAYAEPVPDGLQALQAALDTATTGASITWAVTMSPLTGQITLAPSSGSFALTAINATLGNLLGGIASTTVVTSITAPLAPMHVALLASLYGADANYNLTETGAWAPAEDGTVPGLTSGVVTDGRSFTMDFVPLNVALAAAIGAPMTPAFPGNGQGVAAVRGNLGNNPAWTWADALWAARGVAAGLCVENFTTLCSGTGTGATYDLVSIGVDALTGTKWKRINASYPRWVRWEGFPVTRLAVLPFSMRS